MRKLKNRNQNKVERMTDLQILITLLETENFSYKVKRYGRFTTVSFQGHHVDFYRGGKMIGSFKTKAA